MANCAIVGINWGDEGKGRMVDYLAGKYDVVVRYQGGNNAGHTVINEYGKFALNLLPSGVFHEKAVNPAGHGHGHRLKAPVRRDRPRARKGRAHHPRQPEDLRPRRDGAAHTPLAGQVGGGAPGQGSLRLHAARISPVYGDKYMKKALRMGDLLHPEHLKKQLKRLLDWKKSGDRAGYGAEKIDFDETLKWIEEYGAPLMQHICDAGELLENAARAGKSVLFEAQLGALRDIDYGIYPFTSSSSRWRPTRRWAAGCPALKLDRVVGVTKAYSTCVGEGPFVGELEGEEADKLREAGAEYGAATGRPRRVAWMDLVATRYGTALQGATELALTKLDVLSYLDKIPVCVAYEKNGRRVDRFPTRPIWTAASLSTRCCPAGRWTSPPAANTGICPPRRATTWSHRKERRLPDQIRLRGRGARQPHHPLRGNEHARYVRNAAQQPLRQPRDAENLLPRPQVHHLAQALGGASRERDGDGPAGDAKAGRRTQGARGGHRLRGRPPPRGAHPATT